MEVNEAQELHEHAEHAGHDQSMRPVALTMTVLAVLVAVVTVLGHHTDTDAILSQDRATDTWGEYQAHKIRANEADLTAKMLSVVTIADENAARKLEKTIADDKEKKAEEIKNDMEKAEALEAQVEQAEKKAKHFDLGEVLLEIGLVVTSITLLTKKRAYWFAGMAFSVVGIVAAVLGLLVK
ncbi:MAG: DUF4337 domain-containing protein [Terracidiphilus sp.]|jgi:hypothetical protein